MRSAGALPEMPWAVTSTRRQSAPASSGAFSGLPSAGLRLLDESEQRRQLELESLRAEIAAGRSSGPDRPADEVFDRLEARYAAQAQ